MFVYCFCLCCKLSYTIGYFGAQIPEPLPNASRAAGFSTQFDTPVTGFEVPSGYRWDPTDAFRVDLVNSVRSYFTQRAAATGQTVRAARKATPQRWAEMTIIVAALLFVTAQVCHLRFCARAPNANFLAYTNIMILL
jgi:hypothetical protein